MHFLIPRVIKNSPNIKQFLISTHQIEIFEIQPNLACMLNDIMLIYLIRNVKVMLDRDLADLYGVETKRLKEQVRKNIER